jgi:hypothetical protein
MEEVFDPVVAATRWLAQNIDRAKRDSVAMEFQTGSVSDHVQKCVLELGSRDKVALLEIWSTGEIDYTEHDILRQRRGSVRTFKVRSQAEFSLAIEGCYRQFTVAPGANES